MANIPVLMDIFHVVLSAFVLASRRVLATSNFPFVSSVRFHSLSLILLDSILGNVLVSVVQPVTVVHSVTVVGSHLAVGMMSVLSANRPVSKAVHIWPSTWLQTPDPMLSQRH